MMDAKQQMANEETAKVENDNLISGDTLAAETSHQKDGGVEFSLAQDKISEFWKTFSESRFCSPGFLKSLEEGKAELDLLSLKQLQDHCRQDPISLALWLQGSLEFSCEVWNSVAYKLLNNVIKLINGVIRSVFDYFESESYPPEVGLAFQHRW